MNLIKKGSNWSMLLLPFVFIAACNSGSPFQKKDTPAKIQYKIALENCNPDVSNPLMEVEGQLIARLENEEIYFQNVEQDLENQQLIFNVIEAKDKSKNLEDLRKVFSKKKYLKLITAARLTDPLLKPFLDSIIVQENLMFALKLNDPGQRGNGTYGPMSNLAIISKENFSQIQSVFEKKSGQVPYDFHFGELRNYSSGQKQQGDMVLYASKKGDQNIITQNSVTRAKAAPDPRTGQLEVFLEMDHRGAKDWARMTTAAANDNQRCILMMINGEVISAPSVNSPITGGRSSMSGNFDLQEANSIAEMIQNGKISCDLKIIAEKEL